MNWSSDTEDDNADIVSQKSNSDGKSGSNQTKPVPSGFAITRKSIKTKLVL